MPAIALTPVMPISAAPGAAAAQALAAEAPTTVLTRRLAAGDDAAWRDFHAVYAPRLRRYLLVICRGHEDQSREALQQTFLRAVKHLCVCRTEAELWGWLTVLARSAAADTGRRERRYLGVLDRWFRQQPAPPAVPSDSSDPLEAALVSELAELPAPERELLAQKYLEGDSVRELAEQLGTTEKAVESRLTRARQKLKAAILNRLQNEDPA